MSQPHPFTGIVLAAGKGTRMKSEKPKALMPLLGLPLTMHGLSALKSAGSEPPIVVVGHGAEEVKSALGDTFHYALQTEQLGTGHACLQAIPFIAPHLKTVIVAAGDSPLVTDEAFLSMLQLHLESGAAATVAIAVLENPTGYGRILRDSTGQVTGIVEEKDATPEQKQIREVCTSFYVFEVAALRDTLPRLSNQNAQGEYYLTDVIAMLAQEGAPVVAWVAPDPNLLMGVNNRWELAQAGMILRERLLKHFALQGVTVVDPLTTYVDAAVQIGVDTVIEPNTHLRGNTVVGSGCVLGPDLLVQDSRIGDHCQLLRSHIIQAEIESHVRVGPFANLRPGTILKQGAQIGDFVEIKNAVIGEGAKAMHLSYIGDAEVGARANIGAGTITCNYDGARKHRTVIGSGAFVGSNSTLIAPLTIGDGAYVAAGSAINQPVPPDALAIARSFQTVKEGWAAKRREQSSKKEG